MSRRTALIANGDNALGGSLALQLAHEGVQIILGYHPANTAVAERVRTAVEETGRACMILPGVSSCDETCRNWVEYAVQQFGRLDALVLVQTQPDRPVHDALVDAAARHMEPGAVVLHIVASAHGPKPAPAPTPRVDGVRVGQVEVGDVGAPTTTIGTPATPPPSPTRGATKPGAEPDFSASAAVVSAVQFVCQ